MEGIITTIKQNCRRCYTCVRDCPAKAIRIEDGQASVVAERCIACGNCTKVCGRGAKAYASGIENAMALLNSGDKVAALIAPSFPVAYMAPAGQIIGALKQAGFDYVIEVAYGADLVNQAYHDFLREHPTGIHIASSCPAVVEYVRKYRPELTDKLIPIASPMVATAIAARQRYGENLRCVFVGPCVAKKNEILDPQVEGAIDEALTFNELDTILKSLEVDPFTAPATDVDPPYAGMARIYPIPGGMLESAGIGDGVLDPRLIVTSGHEHTLEALNGLPSDAGGDTLLVEALMCKGCFNGPGTNSPEPGVLRRRRVAEFASESLYRQLDGSLSPFIDNEHIVNLERRFTPCEALGGQEPTEEEIREILGRTNKFFPEDELNCGACGYDTCRDKARAVYMGMAEETMCLPFIIEQAERVCHELNVPWSDLRDVHRHLINSEKLASMGQMAAGVAHELNNPLSTILLYSHILRRKLQDRDDLDHDLQLMADESTRCKKIISNLLDFARQSRVRLEPVSVEGLVRQATESFSGGLVVRQGNRINIVTEVTPGLHADLDHDQMMQVLVNLVNNGVEAMEQTGGTLVVKGYEIPETHRVRISVTDEGPGIPENARDKIFQPFFTTKSIGKGTGLGLPISYGIVKMHNGNIWFEDEPEGGTTFHVEIPTNRPAGDRSSL